VATAEAGIYGPNLESALQAKELTLGHFPQSFEFSSLGGWIAHGGAGQNSDLYGRARDWLVGAKLATPRGLIDTRAYPASSAGPDLNAIILGSEGVFGIITQATIRLRANPRARQYCGYLFRTFEQGVAAIRTASQEGLSPAMLRLSDAGETRFFRAYAATQSAFSASRRIASLYLRLRRFDSQACAMISGFEGEPHKVEAVRRRFASIAKSFGAISLGNGVGRRWLKDRFHGPYLRDPMLERGVGVDTLETSVSWSKLDSLHAAVCAALHAAIRETVPRPDARGVVMCHISHSYSNGASLYFTIIFPRRLDDEIGQWRKIKTAASDAIVSNGGTISHHHGVGLDHLPWMEAEKGALGIDVLRAIKRAVDPKGILNPGKLIPG
jgi:alkyldihydroxyacetonephosphate synthase